jgi:RHS repeat-associated protein
MISQLTTIKQRNFLVVSLKLKLYYHPDHLGSTSLITNDSGGVVENIFYDPYGEMLDPYGAILLQGTTSRYQYEGKEFSQATGDYDFHFRKYSPQLGIFTQPEQLFPNVYDPQQLNRYSFERRNPYKYVDENGRVAVYYGAQTSGGATLGGSATTGRYFSYDLTSGYRGGLFTQFGIGLTTPTASLGGVFGISPLGNYKDLEGQSTSLGFDIGDAFSLGLGISFPRNNQNKVQFSKFSLQLTAAPGSDLNLPLPFSAYFFRSNTYLTELGGGYLFALFYNPLYQINGVSYQINQANVYYDNHNQAYCGVSITQAKQSTSFGGNTNTFDTGKGTISSKPTKEYCNTHSDRRC